MANLKFQITSLALHEAGGRSASDGPGRQRMRSGLVITQVALAIVLLAGAGLTLKSFWHAENAPLGFDPHGVVNFEIALPEAKYKTPEQKDAFWTDLLQRAQRIPGVQAAAVSANSPFDDTEEDSYFHVTGTPPVPLGQQPSAEVSVVSPDYFRLMGMPILRGRGFGPEDLPGEKVIRARSSSMSRSRKNILLEKIPSASTSMTTRQLTNTRRR